MVFYLVLCKSLLFSHLYIFCLPARLEDTSTVWYLFLPFLVLPTPKRHTTVTTQYILVSEARVLLVLHAGVSLYCTTDSSLQQMLHFSSYLTVCFRSTEAKQLNRIVRRTELMENPSYGGTASILEPFSIYGRTTFTRKWKGHFPQGKRADFSRTRPEKPFIESVFPLDFSMNLVFRATSRLRADIFTITLHKRAQIKQGSRKVTFACAQSSLSHTFIVRHTVLEFILSSLRWEGQRCMRELKETEDVLRERETGELVRRGGICTQVSPVGSRR